MSENIIRFSNKMCLLLKKRENRINDCKKCKFFDKCNDIYLKKLNRKIEFVQKPKLLSALDFQLQFEGKQEK
jgi:hypothetical protein